MQFLLASQRRANATRAARPDLAAQEARWLATGAAAYLLTLRPGALRWWSAVGLMLDWHLGMAETEDGRPRPLGRADAATLARAWLVPVIARHPHPSLLVAGYATDVADGVLARATKPTRLGRDLESLVDVCFSVAALRALVERGALHRASAAAEATRMIAGASTAAATWFGRAAPPDPAIVRAARAMAPLRAGGVVLAAMGRRRPGTMLVLAGSAASLTAHCRTLAASLRAS